MYSETQRDIDNIQSLFFDKVEITRPSYMGEVHSIYIVKSKYGKDIFRFSDKQTASQNMIKSQVLRKYNIPVPNIGFYKIGTKYCEQYAFIEGKTLYERQQEGLSKEQIQKIFSQIYDICHRMSNIPIQEFKSVCFKQYKTDFFFQLMNLSPMVIGHDDLHDKNILLDKDDNVCAFLDLDAVCTKPFALFLLRLFQGAEKYGYNIESIKDFDPKTYNNKNLLNIKQQTQIYYALQPFVQFFSGIAKQK